MPLAAWTVSAAKPSLSGTSRQTHSRLSIGTLTTNDGILSLSLFHSTLSYKIPLPSTAAHQQPQGAMKYLPDIPYEARAPSPPKRRRAKRTEAERIHYLRSDPYVAQFEAFRVLCASCHKWIRLRPNSTYCSIPWDAHRKSCLSKKLYVFFRMIFSFFF